MDVTWQIKGADLDFTPEPIPGESLADVLIGTKRHRPSAKPTRENREFLEEALAQVVKEGRPIQVLIMWGGAKCYGQFPFKGPDILDVVALKRLASISKSIQQFHSEGIRFKILFEDYTERRLNGFMDPTYFCRLQGLKDHLGLTNVELVKESSTLTPNFDKRVELCAYSIFRGTASHLGWRGYIPWEHYLKRAATELPGATEHRLRWHVSQYLGICLARYTENIHPPHDVKLSFSPYPSSVPNSLRRGRVEHKLKESRNNHESAAPWCAFSLIRRDGWSMVSVNQARQREYLRATVHIANFPIHVLI